MNAKFTGTHLFVGVITLLVTAAVVAGLIIAGSPEAERMRRADQQRQSDLQQISYAVDVYWNRAGSLPASLDELTKSPDVYVQNIRDPRTTETYTYRTTDVDAYELCTNFETPTGSGPDQPPRAASETFWDHGVGHTCYALKVRADANGIKPPIIR